jgi:hypothetical protein
MRTRALLLAAAYLAGCASTTIESTGSALLAPLCRPGEPPRPVLVLWGPQWRPDQKEPAQREAFARKGLEEFLAATPCAAARVERFAAGGPVPPDAELLRRARSTAPPADLAVLVTVRELGPVLLIGIPVIVEGGTEVVLDVRVLDTASSAMRADVRIHWKNGGTFVVKGVGSLDRDMAAALRAALLPGL